MYATWKSAGLISHAKLAAANIWWLSTPYDARKGKDVRSDKFTAHLGSSAGSARPAFYD